MFTQPENTPFSLVEARTLVNGLLRWTSKDDNWAVTLEGRNLTDEYFFVNATDFIGGLNGYAQANPGLPRTWMLGLRRNF
jgi:outer membrane receptor protein involved in Fe transport